MFRFRSDKKELLDAETIPAPDLFRNLQELETINQLLGGHAVTLFALEQLQLKKDKVYTLLDIGCGGGDTLRAISRWANAKGLTIQLTGVDLKADCISYAIKKNQGYSIQLIQNDYRTLASTHERYDIIVNALFCHHLSEDELVNLFTWCSQHASLAFITNDLHRHPFAYYSIKWLTALFSKSYLVKHDAPLSVLRGFRKAEWQQLLSRVAGQPLTVNLYWKWAFRWLLMIKPNNNE